ncbi:MAG: hypothetical protein J0L87_05885 [Bacteroidetes bacterium]|nr:hypothetical protein [Bacteroidota bacterium]
MRTIVFDIQTSSKAFRLTTCLLFFLFLSVLKTNAQQYDINDPRNPDCPCHKMQELADKEFALLNGSENVQSDSDLEDGEDKQQQVDRSLNGNGSVVYDQLARRRRSVWIKKTVFKISNKYRFKKRGKINVAICYKW